MDNDKNMKNNLEDIPELNLDVLDEIESASEESTDTQETPVVQESEQQSVQQEEPVEEPAEDPIEEFIFDETDKISLFDETDKDDLIFVFDEEEQELPEVDDEDLVFVDAVSVRDRRKMASVKMSETPDNYQVDVKKTKRRSSDETEIKKERSVAFAKNNIVAIGIFALVIILILGGIAVGVKKFKANHSSVPKTSASEETYQVEVQDEINELMNSYFQALAKNDSYTLKELLSSTFANEMEYIYITSQYIESYDNLVCYAKDGLEAGDYIVAVYYEVKYEKIRETAPGMRFFYVETNSEGDLYINSLYNQYNLTYSESGVDPMIVNLMSTYQGDADVQEMLTQVQDNYDAAVASNDNLKEMVEVTIPEALADWSTVMQEYLDEKSQTTIEDDSETAEGTEGETDDPDAAESDDTDNGESDAAESDNSESETSNTSSDAQVNETEASGNVYATDSINIRKSPSTDSEKLASAAKGSELIRLAVTEDGWTKIKTGDVVGYVKTEFLSDEKPAGGNTAASSHVTLTDNVNMREDSRNDAEKVAVVLAGETVEVLDVLSNGWTKVKYNGRTGYIRSDVLK